MEAKWFTSHIDWLKIKHDITPPPFQAGKSCHADTQFDIGGFARPCADENYPSLLRQRYLARIASTGDFEPVKGVSLTKEDHEASPGL